MGGEEIRSRWKISRPFTDYNCISWEWSLVLHAAKEKVRGWRKVERGGHGVERRDGGGVMIIIVIIIIIR